LLLTDIILRDAYKASGLWGQISLDGLVSKWSKTRGDEIALVDPANLSRISTLEPKRIDWQTLDRAIDAVADRLISLGLKTDDIVAWQCGNVVEAPIAMLGILRARMIAVPLPPLWAAREASNALVQISPRAIVAGSTIAGRGFIEAARDIAVDVFSIRHVLGFGPDIPDGVLALDDIFDDPSDDLQAVAHRTDEAEHIATMCWWTSKEILPRVMPRSHNHWIAAGLGPIMDAQITERDIILSANFMTGLAGIGPVLVPWLLSGSRLVLHHPFDRQTFSDQATEEVATIAVLPAYAVADFNQPADTLTVERIISVWPDLYSARQSGSATHSLPVIDVFCLGEAGIVTRKRDRNIPAGQVPVGRVALPSGADEPPCLIETRIKGGGVKSDTTESLLRGELQVAGPMVPATEIGAAEQRTKTIETQTYRYDEGFVGTDLPCQITTTVPPKAEPSGQIYGVIVVGGLALSIAALEASYREIEGIEDVAVYGYDDKMLGQRIGAIIVANAANGVQSGSLRGIFENAGIDSYKIPDKIESVPEIQRDHDGHAIFTAPVDPQRMSG
jgi:non-ribosomal peptide synthetase component E (peptide arylation enzyme)